MDTLNNFNLLRELIRNNLAKWEQELSCQEENAEPVISQRRAAVVVTVFESQDVPQLLIIKRSMKGSNPGQWALPGGHVEPGESPAEAALRELYEETGLLADQQHIVGTLDIFETTRGIAITPFVAFVPGAQKLARNTDEVHSLHPIPVANLLKSGVPRWKTLNTKQLLQMPLRHDMVIHAPTGAILRQFVEVGIRGNRTRVAELLEPDFTTR